MQQTDKYKLNKPGIDDPLAIAPLNENMDKLEAAITAETETRQTETAALDLRIAALEASHIVTGGYAGNGTQQDIDLGFAPTVLFLFHPGFSGGLLLIFFPDETRNALTLTETGFHVAKPASGVDLNNAKSTYKFVALA